MLQVKTYFQAAQNGFQLYRHVVSLGRNGHPTSVLLEIPQIGQLHEVNFDWWGIF
jgi:hypothetical protein